VIRTKKQDWFTDYLSSQGFWVGGSTVLFNSSPRLSALQTIRYFKSNKPEFLQVYILEFIEPLDHSIDYEEVIKFYESNLLIKPKFTLAIWPNLSQVFAVLESDRLFTGLDTSKVLDWFRKYDPDLVGSTSYLKPINRSFTDFFHLWARKHMKGFQNDIDAYKLNGKQIHMLELKRPKESSKTWKPYQADLANYVQFSNLCNQLDWQLTNVAYTENERGILKIFSEVKYQDKQLQYDTAILQLRPEQDFLDLINKLQYEEEYSKR
jgi:hypothetical protein